MFSASSCFSFTGETGASVSLDKLSSFTGESETGYHSRGGNDGHPTASSALGASRMAAGLRQLLFGDAPLRAMATLGLKYGAGDLIAQQATNPGGEINCARAVVFASFGTYYGFVNYSVFRALAWSPVPAGLWPKALFSAFFDGCVHVPILLYPQLLRSAQTASRQRQGWTPTARDAPALEHCGLLGSCAELGAALAQSRSLSGAPSTTPISLCPAIQAVSGERARHVRREPRASRALRGGSV